MSLENAHIAFGGPEYTVIHQAFKFSAHGGNDLQLVESGHTLLPLYLCQNIVNGTSEQESRFRNVIMLAFDDFLEATVVSLMGT